ncbi:hypothetical protein JAAARDRAFT_209881 [Jaapia argillacea MUCL 33604]|uniref:Uncharacterized protein n=1 Tax=Jaapia argillacea MUCL 33604 TaxID=933084 RepID=A0A067PFH9_9AGAM|nr:hypothetical protein JAAARDRAFT_209881 [Jaapia argillacea MUCL 33604]
MITITQDAEFMVNMVSANPIPAGNRFFAFNDENLNPAVLSHSQDNKLELVLEVDGTAQLFDFGQICGLSGDVQAVGLLQDADLNVWIAVATDAGNSLSNLYLIINLQPSALLAPPSDSIIKSSDTFAEIHGLYMSNFSRDVGGLKFPLLFVASQPLDRITQEDQLGYVDISVDSDKNTTITLDTTWKLATNPLKIIDVVFGQCRVGKGAFVLYETVNNALKLQFRVFEGRNFSVELDAPTGAQCLTAYEDSTANSTVFLVGGDVITQYTYDDYKKSTGTGTTIVQDPDSNPLGIKDIHNALNGTNITVWYTVGSDAAFYYSASTSSMGQGLLVQLLPDGAGGQISGLLASKNDDDVLVNTLVSVDESGDLTILQQASDTGMWESHPFYIPSTTDNLNIPSFTIRVKAHTDTTDKGERVSGSKLHLTASGFVRVQSNGVTTTVSKNGAWYTADHTGTVTVIIATADMSCYTLQVDKFQADGGDEISLDVPLLVPSSKINKKLAAITSGQDLLDAKTQTGENLIDPGSVTLDDANNAASIITELNKQQITIGQPTTGQPGPKIPTRKKTGKVVHIAGCIPKDRRVQELLATTDFSSGSSPWDFFWWLVDKAEDVATWFLQTVDDVLQFVVEWAGKIYNFVCDTVTAIGKALSWVFAKIKVALNKLIDFLGFLFAWDDILQFSDSIVTYVNVSFAYGESQIDAFDEKAKTFIDDLRATLKGRVQPASVSANTTTKDPDATSDQDNLKQGVGYNWPAYQLNHGGFQKDAPMDVAEPSDKDVVQQIWDDFKSEIDVITKMVNDIATLVSGLFDPNTNSAELFSQFTDDMIDALCDSFKNILDIILKSIVLAMQKINDLGNYAIEIPVFTALWKFITKGRDFTVFNFVALIMAIPATLIYKLVKGKALPVLKGRLTEDDLGKFLSGDTSLDPTLAADIDTTRTVSIVAVGYILYEVTALTFAIDEIAGEAGGSASAASSKAISKAGAPRQLRGTILVGTIAGNAIDTVTLSLTAVSLYFTWPLTYGHDVDLHSAVWALDLSNGIFLAISRLIGWYTGIPRVETKRFVGLYEMATAYPIFILDLIIAVHEYQLPDDDPEKDDQLTTRHVIEDVFQLVSCGGFCVAAVTDEVQPEVSLVGLAVFGLSLTLELTFVFVDAFLKLTAK